MKIKNYIFTIFLFVICIITQTNASTVFFDSKNIKVKEEGNLIYASKGVLKIPEEDILIEGDKSIYNKLISELTIIGNVRFFDNLNQIFIESEKAIYNQLDNTIHTKGKTFFNIEKKYQIDSRDVLYNRNTMIVSSQLDTSVYDNKNNIYNFKEGFVFNTIKEVISSKTTNIIDSENNSYLFDKAKINLKTRELAGVEVKVDFINNFFGNENNDPILKGKSATSNDDKTIIQKAVFSTCNTANKNCRGWELQSEEFRHNKTDKLFEYKNSWLKVFDQRIFFMPYFSHPDPSVKRKSGFLTPVYSSSDNLGRAVNIPYFYVLSDSKDMTFNPRIYSDNDFILQSEYRQAFKNSKLIADFSFNQDENNTNTHAFIDLNGQINNKTSYNLQLQNVTNDNYLKVHDFKGIQDTNTLMSNINPSSLTSFFKIARDIDENTGLSTSLRMYEDLSVTNKNDKYQYIFPDFSFYKNIDLEESYNGTFNFGSSGYQKLYNTNIYEAQVNNDFSFSSFDYIKTGLVTNYNFLLKNFNTYSENSTVFEDNADHELFGTLILNSELPLRKKLQYSTNYLKPKFQFKFSPTNGKDISSDSGRLGYDSLFSSNRIGRSDMVEEGKSLTIGLEFEKQNLTNEKLFGLSFGNVIKDKKNFSMPSKAKLDQTRSDIVGNIFYKPNESIKLEYNFSYDRDLDFSNYDSIKARFGANKLITSFDYFTENHEIGNSETISNDTLIKFNDEHSILFNTIKDLKTDFTEHYRLSYDYKTDCLFATFQYQKKFFRDGNLVPDENLSFLIKFIPFTELRGSANTLFKKN